MADTNVYTSSNGGKAASFVPSQFGLLRIELDQSTKRAFACVVEEKGTCEITAVFNPGTSTSSQYSFRVNDKESLDSAAIGPKIGQAIKNALSGTTVSAQNADEVGQLLVNANHFQKRQEKAMSAGK